MNAPVKQGMGAKVHRRVIMQPDDPGRVDGSKSTVFGVSLAMLAVLAGVGESTIRARWCEWQKATAAGLRPPPHSVDLTDWWDVARWVLEHRRIARLQREGVGIVDAREQAGLDVARFMASFRELFG